MERLLALILALFLSFSFVGCKKELTAEQKIANLERSNQELAGAAERARAEADRVKQQNQDYLDAYAKASGKR